MTTEVATKIREMRQKIEKLEEELQGIKWDIFVPQISKESVVNLSKGILGKKFEKGVEYQRKIRKDWEKRMRRLNL